MKSYAILFDLDGVLADWRHRLHLREAGQWDDFWAQMVNDPTVEAGALTYNLLVNQAQTLGRLVREHGLDADVPEIDILTCRPLHTRDSTVAWMRSSGLLLPRNLHMRARDDLRPHHEIKWDMYQQFYRSETVVALFDDNPETIRVFSDRGVSCFQFREGMNT